MLSGPRKHSVHIDGLSRDAMRIESPFLVRMAGMTCARGFRLLFRTIRKDVRTFSVSPYNASGSQRYLYSVWHDSAVIAAFGGRHSHTVALTSRHRDGAFVASIVRAIGVGTVRGSSGRSGQTAARQLLRVAKTHDIVITPDGPRGPRRTMSRGIVYLASRTGNPIVPTAFACSHAWEIPGSWTTQIVPKPLSRVMLFAGEPIIVPADLNDGEIEIYRVQLQLAMDALQDRATRILRQDSPAVLGDQTSIANPTNGTRWRSARDTSVSRGRSDERRPREMPCLRPRTGQSIHR